MSSRPVLVRRFASRSFAACRRQAAFGNKPRPSAPAQNSGDSARSIRPARNPVAPKPRLGNKPIGSELKCLSAAPKWLGYREQNRAPWQEPTFFSPDRISRHLNQPPSELCGTTFNGPCEFDSRLPLSLPILSCRERHWRVSDFKMRGKFRLIPQRDRLLAQQLPQPEELAQPTRLGRRGNEQRSQQAFRRHLVARISASLGGVAGNKDGKNANIAQSIDIRDTSRLRFCFH